MTDTTDTSIALLPLARQQQVTVNAVGSTALTVQGNGTVVATEPALDFVDASGIAFGVTDDSANGRVKVTPVTTASGDVSGPLTALVVGAKKVLATMLGSGAAVSGAVPVADGSGGAAYALPHGHEFSYAEVTSPVSITATTEGTATTAITAGAVTFDGSTVVMVEFYAPYLQVGTNRISVTLYDGSSSIGIMVDDQNLNLSSAFAVASRRLTPSNASHTYSIRAWVNGGTGTVGAGAGGAGNDMPAFIRIVKA